jgi:hypothetical protein
MRSLARIIIGTRLGTVAVAIAAIALVAVAALPPPAAAATAKVDGVVSAGEYDFNVSFSGGHYNLYWKIEGDRIRLGVVADTKGFVGLGINPDTDTFMQGGDLLIGYWVSATDWDILDTYATEQFSVHPNDTSLGGTYDIIEKAVAQTGNTTTMELVRKLVTGDSRDKPIITNASMRIIWSTGNTDDITQYHGARGLARVQFSTGKVTVIKVPALWPRHAITMVTSTALFAATYGLLALKRQKKKWWLEAHHYTGALAVVLAFVGFILAYRMVASMGMGHLRILHAYLGLTTLIIVTVSLVGGFVYMYSKPLKRPMRKPHIWVGAATIAMAVWTVTMGLLFVFKIYPK